VGDLIMYYSFISQVLIVYIVTIVITSSSILEPIREYIKSKFKTPKHKPFIECRLCVSFWISIIVCGIFYDISNMLAVYGCSYFLATQERL